MIYVPICKKLWNRYSKFLFKNFWQIFPILNSDLVSGTGAAGLQTSLVVYSIEQIDSYIFIALQF